MHTHTYLCTNQEEVDPGSFRLADLCLNQLAMVYLNISQVTQIPSIYGFVGLTHQVQALIRNSIFGTIYIMHQ